METAKNQLENSRLPAMCIFCQVTCHASFRRERQRTISMFFPIDWKWTRWLKPKRGNWGLAGFDAVYVSLDDLIHFSLFRWWSWNSVFFSFFCTANTRPWPWVSFLRPPKFRTICSQKCNRWKRAIKKGKCTRRNSLWTVCQEFSVFTNSLQLKKRREGGEQMPVSLFFLLRLKGISQTRIGNEFPLLSSLIHFKPIEWIFVSP